MEGTTYQMMEETPRQRGETSPALEKKDEGQSIALSNPKTLLEKSFPLNKAITERTSHRKYLNQPLSFEELSYLLYVTQGVKKVTSKATFRMVPAAGARHALLTYLYIRNVKGIPKGLYRYHALEHELVKLPTPDTFQDDLVTGALGQKMFETSALNFIWVADKARMYHTYGERGYRYLHLDAGHVCQNLYLACELIDAGTVAVAAYDDKKINTLMNIDGDNFFTIYMAPVGKV